MCSLEVGAVYTRLCACGDYRIAWPLFLVFLRHYSPWLLRPHFTDGTMEPERFFLWSVFGNHSESLGEVSIRCLSYKAADAHINHCKLVLVAVAKDLLRSSRGGRVLVIHQCR